jgi:hypothetical protein
VCTEAVAVVRAVGADFFLELVISLCDLRQVYLARRVYTDQHTIIRISLEQSRLPDK